MTPSNEVGDVETKLPFLRRNNPAVQILLASACLMFNPGFYLATALLGAGGGQPTSASMANIANGVLYGVFACAAIPVGSLLNAVGPRPTLMVGCTGYALFSGALWYFSDTGHLWFPVFAGAYLGISAAFLWTTAVYMINAYPEEREKARWRAIQWTCNMTGSAIGTSIALGIVWKAKASTGVPRSVYITFIVLQVCSLGFASLVLPPDQLRRSDGTALSRFDPISSVELLKISGGLFKDWRVLLLLPCMLVPEMFFPLQATINAYAFNLRTRTLNSLLNNLIQLPASAFLAYLLDNERFGPRRRRMVYGLAFVSIWITGAYIAQTIWLASWNFSYDVAGPDMDFTDPAYAGAVTVYLFYAAQYGIFTSIFLYTLAAFTNDPRKSAGLAGMYIGLASAGTAISFGLNASLVPFVNINAAFFALTVLCWPVLYFTGQSTLDTNYGVEETVVIPIHVKRELGLDDTSKEIPEAEVMEKSEAGLEFER